VTVRVGLIGTGFARRVQLPGLRLVPGVQVTAVASGRRSNAEAVAREFGIPHVFDDGADLARSSEVDLVIVASTPDSHARYAIAAVEAGKHVLCEKPTALNADEAARMLAAAERRPEQLAWIDHELRYEPNRRRIRDLIAAGAIGEVRHIELVLRPYLRGDGRPQATDAPWNWWYDAGRGGGILGAVGSHLIDLCRYWTASEVAHVAGGVATFVKQRRDDAGAARAVTADDFASFVLRLAGGTVATVTLSTVAFHGPGHHAQITGAEGTVVLTGETKLELGRPGGPLEDISMADDLSGQVPVNNMWARSFVRLMRELVRVLDGGGGGRGGGGGAAAAPAPATFRDGLAVQRVLDAVRAGGAAPLD
jgi:predicted dehydrogenase